MPEQWKRAPTRMFMGYGCRLVYIARELLWYYYSPFKESTRILKQTSINGSFYKLIFCWVYGFSPTGALLVPIPIYLIVPLDPFSLCYIQTAVANWLWAIVTVLQLQAAKPFLPSAASGSVDQHYYNIGFIYTDGQNVFPDAYESTFCVNTPVFNKI